MCTTPDSFTLKAVQSETHQNAITKPKVVSSPDLIWCREYTQGRLIDSTREQVDCLEQIVITHRLQQLMW